MRCLCRFEKLKTCVRVERLPELQCCKDSSDPQSRIRFWKFYSAAKTPPTHSPGSDSGSSTVLQRLLRPTVQAPILEVLQCCKDSSVPQSRLRFWKFYSAAKTP